MVFWQKKRNNLLMKSFTLVLTGVFLFSGTGFAALSQDIGVRRTPLNRHSGEEDKEALSISQIKVPKAYGRIIDSYEPGVDREKTYSSRFHSKNKEDDRVRGNRDNDTLTVRAQSRTPKLIIHIQDAHCNYEAQENIAKLIEDLGISYGVKLVAIEGSVGDIDPSFFTSFPIPQVTHEVSTYFLKEGKINGAEWLLINRQDLPFSVFGIEEKDLYIEDRDLFIQSLSFKEEGEKYCKALEKVFDRLKAKLYTPELKELESKVHAYKNKEVSFIDYCNYLADIAEKKEIDLENNFPNFSYLMQSFRLEKQINLRRMEKERVELIDTLTQTLNEDEISDLLAKSVAYKLNQLSHLEYHQYLKELTTKKGQTLFGLFGRNLEMYVEYLTLRKKADAGLFALFAELDNLAEGIRERLYADDNQRRLGRLSRNAGLLNKLFALKMNNEEYKYYGEHKEEFKRGAFEDFLRRNKAGENLPRLEFESQIPILENFYGIAFRRDHALVEKTLARMAEEKQDIAVLNAGGFHTKGMTALLREQGISYVVIAPRITNTDAATPYIDVLCNKLNPLEEFLSAKAEHLSTTSFIAQNIITQALDDATLEALIGEKVTLDLLVFIHQEMQQHGTVALEKFHRVVETYKAAYLAAIGQGGYAYALEQKLMAYFPYALGMAEASLTPSDILADLAQPGVFYVRLRNIQGVEVGGRFYALGTPGTSDNDIPGSISSGQTQGLAFQFFAANNPAFAQKFDSIRAIRLTQAEPAAGEKEPGAPAGGTAPGIVTRTIYTARADALGQLDARQQQAFAFFEQYVQRNAPGVAVGVFTPGEEIAFTPTRESGTAEQPRKTFAFFTLGGNFLGDFQQDLLAYSAASRLAEELAGFALKHERAHVAADYNLAQLPGLTDGAVDTSTEAGRRFVEDLLEQNPSWEAAFRGEEGERLTNREIAIFLYFQYWRWSERTLKGERLAEGEELGTFGGKTVDYQLLKDTPALLEAIIHNRAGYLFRFLVKEDEQDPAKRIAGIMREIRAIDREYTLAKQGGRKTQVADLPDAGSVDTPREQVKGVGVGGEDGSAAELAVLGVDTAPLSLAGQIAEIRSREAEFAGLERQGGIVSTIAVSASPFMADFVSGLTFIGEGGNQVSAVLNRGDIPLADVDALVGALRAYRAGVVADADSFKKHYGDLELYFKVLAIEQKNLYEEEPIALVTIVRTEGIDLAIQALAVLAVQGAQYYCAHRSEVPSLHPIRDVDPQTGIEVYYGYQDLADIINTIEANSFERIINSEDVVHYLRDEDIMPAEDGRSAALQFIKMQGLKEVGRREVKVEEEGFALLQGYLEAKQEAETRAQEYLKDSSSRTPRNERRWEEAVKEANRLRRENFQTIVRRYGDGPTAIFRNNIMDGYLGGLEELRRYLDLARKLKKSQHFIPIFRDTAHQEDLTMLHRELARFINGDERREIRGEKNVFRAEGVRLSEFYDPDEARRIYHLAMDDLEDIEWTIRREVLQNIDKMVELGNLTLPDMRDRLSDFGVRELKAMNAVFNAMDFRMESRGRDSLGVSAMYTFEDYAAYEEFLDKLETASEGRRDLVTEFETRQKARDLGNMAINLRPGYDADGDIDRRRPVSITFIYKVAAAVGKLGDNVRALKEGVKGDRIIQQMIRESFTRNTKLIHTRWASVGIVSIENCHPVGNKGLYWIRRDDAGEEIEMVADLDVAAPQYGRNGHIYVVLNGDIENYPELKAEYEGGSIRRRISPRITTDTKIIALDIEKFLGEGHDLLEAFRLACRELKGQFAIQMNSDLEPGKVFLAQTGTGQSLFVGISEEGFHPSSEVYGVVEDTPRYINIELGEAVKNPRVLERLLDKYPDVKRMYDAGDRDGAYEQLVSREQGTIVVVDQDRMPEPELMTAMTFGDTPIVYTEDDIMEADISARDIDLGGQPSYLKKEIGESADMAESTMLGKIGVVRDSGGEETPSISVGERELPTWVLDEITSGKRKKVVFAAMGTANAAGEAISNVMGNYLKIARPDIEVTSCIATEGSGFQLEEDMSDTIVVAVSQSGGTTDTMAFLRNAKARGAAMLGIINIRHSMITDILDGVFYTGRGRDMEVAVASTKAYYAQVTAGSIYAMRIAEALGIDRGILLNDIKFLLSVPDKIRRFVSQLEEQEGNHPLIRAANRWPLMRPDWRCLANNASNRTAAKEIRIKLSEETYTSLPASHAANYDSTHFSRDDMAFVNLANAPRSERDVERVMEIIEQGAIPIVYTDENDRRFDRMGIIVMGANGKEFYNGPIDVVKLPVVPQGSEYFGPLFTVLGGHYTAYYTALAMNQRAVMLTDAVGAISAARESSEERRYSEEEILASEEFQEVAESQYRRVANAMFQGNFNAGFNADYANRLMDLFLFLRGRIDLDRTEEYLGRRYTARELLDEFSMEGFSRVCIEELIRGIDAIREQAKYVTVGVERKIETGKERRAPAAIEARDIGEIDITGLEYCVDTQIKDVPALIEGTIQAGLSDTQLLPQVVRDGISAGRFKRVVVAGAGRDSLAAKAISETFLADYVRNSGQDIVVSYEAVIAQSIEDMETDMEDTLIIALGQMGDSEVLNGYLERAKQRGAAVLGIANQGFLINEGSLDGVFRTEVDETRFMPEAGFYTQMAAGAIYAIRLGEAWGVAGDVLNADIREIQSIPQKCNQFLLQVVKAEREGKGSHTLVDAAGFYPLRKVNWKSLGGGSNFHAAEMASFMLSRAVGKDAAVDTTENFKHIDFSTHALAVLNVANVYGTEGVFQRDLPGEINKMLAHRCPLLVITQEGDDILDRVDARDQSFVSVGGAAYSREMDVVYLPHTSEKFAPFLTLFANQILAHSIESALEGEALSFYTAFMAIDQKISELRERGVNGNEILENPEFRERVTYASDTLRPLIREGRINRALPADFTAALSVRLAFLRGDLPLRDTGAYLFRQFNNADAFLNDCRLFMERCREQLVSVSEERQDAVTELAQAAVEDRLWEIYALRRQFAEWGLAVEELDRLEGAYRSYRQTGEPQVVMFADSGAAHQVEIIIVQRDREGILATVTGEIAREDINLISDDGGPYRILVYRFRGATIIRVSPDNVSEAYLRSLGFPARIQTALEELESAPLELREAIRRELVGRGFSEDELESLVYVYTAVAESGHIGFVVKRDPDDSGKTKIIISQQAPNTDALTAVSASLISAGIVADIYQSYSVSREFRGVSISKMVVNVPLQEVEENLFVGTKREAFERYTRRGDKETRKQALGVVAEVGDWWITRTEDGRCGYINTSTVDFMDLGDNIVLRDAVIDGKGIEIGDNVVLENTMVGSNAIIGAGTEIIGRDGIRSHVFEIEIRENCRLVNVKGYGESVIGDNVWLEADNGSPIELSDNNNIPSGARLVGAIDGVYSEQAVYQNAIPLSAWDRETNIFSVERVEIPVEGLGQGIAIFTSGGSIISPFNRTIKPTRIDGRKPGLNDPVPLGPLGYEIGPVDPDKKPLRGRSSAHGVPVRIEPLSMQAGGVLSTVFEPYSPGEDEEWVRENTLFTHLLTGAVVGTPGAVGKVATVRQGGHGPRSASQGLVMQVYPELWAWMLQRQYEIAGPAAKEVWVNKIYPNLLPSMLANVQYARYQLRRGEPRILPYREPQLEEMAANLERMIAEDTWQVAVVDGRLTFPNAGLNQTVLSDLEDPATRKLWLEENGLYQPNPVSRPAIALEEWEPVEHNPKVEIPESAEVVNSKLGGATLIGEGAVVLDSELEDCVVEEGARVVGVKARAAIFRKSSTTALSQVVHGIIEEGAGVHQSRIIGGINNESVVGEKAKVAGAHLVRSEIGQETEISAGALVIDAKLGPKVAVGSYMNNVTGPNGEPTPGGNNDHHWLSGSEHVQYVPARIYAGTEERVTLEVNATNVGANGALRGRVDAPITIGNIFLGSSSWMEAGSRAGEGAEITGGTKVNEGESIPLLTSRREYGAMTRLPDGTWFCDPRLDVLCPVAGIHSISYEEATLEQKKFMAKSDTGYWIGRRLADQNYQGRQALTEDEEEHFRQVDYYTENLILQWLEWAKGVLASRKNIPTPYEDPLYSIVDVIGRAVNAVESDLQVKDDTQLTKRTMTFAALPLWLGTIRNARQDSELMNQVMTTIQFRGEEHPQYTGLQIIDGVERALVALGDMRYRLREGDYGDKRYTGVPTAGDYLLSVARDEIGIPKGYLAWRPRGGLGPQEEPGVPAGGTRPLEIHTGVEHEEQEFVATEIDIAAIPNGFASNLSDYGLSLEEVSYTQIAGRPFAEGELPLESVRARISLEIAQAQALTGAGYTGVIAGLDKKEDKDRISALKKEGDGNAVSLGINSLEELARKYNVCIIVLGNEGPTRDDAPGMRVGRLFNPEGKKNDTLLFLNDAVEGTNNMVSGELGALSFVGFVEPGNAFETDGYRVTVSFKGSKPVKGINPIIKGENTVSNVLEQVAESEGYAPEAMDRFYKEHYVLFISRGRHEEAEAQLKSLNKEHGLEYTSSDRDEPFKDGDFLPRVGAAIGDEVNGKKPVVMLAGGAIEHMTSLMAAAAMMDPEERAKLGPGEGMCAFSIHMTKENMGEKDPVHNMNGAGRNEKIFFTEKERAERDNLDRMADELAKQGTKIGKLGDLGRIITERDVVGSPVVAVTSITGARPDIDGELLAKLLQGVEYTEDGRVILSSLLIENGRAFVVKTTLKTEDVRLTQGLIKLNNDFGLSPELQRVKDIRAKWQVVSDLLGRGVSINEVDLALTQLMEMIVQTELPETIINHLAEAVSAAKATESREYERALADLDRGIKELERSVTAGPETLPGVPAGGGRPGEPEDVYGVGESRLAQIAEHSTLSHDPADYNDLLPENIRWAKAHGYTEMTLNPSNLSSYIGHVLGSIQDYPEFAQEIRRLLRDKGLRGVEFEHALITYVIRGFLGDFAQLSYEVDADIELARFQEGWEDRPEEERSALEEAMVEKTVAEILRISAINPEKMLVKVPNTPIGHEAVKRVKRDYSDVRINFTLFFSLEDSIKGLKNLDERDRLSVFLSRPDDLTQNQEEYKSALNYAQGLVGLITAKRLYEFRTINGIPTRIIMASLGAKTDIPGWMYVYCLTGGGQILTMPQKQGVAIEGGEDVPPIQDNLSLPMEEFLLPFVTHPKCIEEARKRGFWSGFADMGTMSEEAARELIGRAVEEWEQLDSAVKERIFATLAKDGFGKFYKPFSEARKAIQQVEQEQLVLLREEAEQPDRFDYPGSPDATYRGEYLERVTTETYPTLSPVLQEEIRSNPGLQVACDYSSVNLGKLNPVVILLRDTLDRQLMTREGLANIKEQLSGKVRLVFLDHRSQTEEDARRFLLSHGFSDEDIDLGFFDSVIYQERLDVQREAGAYNPKEPFELVKDVISQDLNKEVEPEQLAVVGEKGAVQDILRDEMTYVLTCLMPASEETEEMEAGGEVASVHAAISTVLRLFALSQAGGLPADKVKAVLPGELMEAVIRFDPHTCSDLAKGYRDNWEWGGQSTLSSFINYVYYSQPGRELTLSDLRGLVIEQSPRASVSDEYEQALSNMREYAGNV